MAPSTPSSPKDCNLRINVAVMQRMYMSALKVEIAQLGLKLRFAAANSNSEDGDDHSPVQTCASTTPGEASSYGLLASC
jgi:hypothetical protein